MISLPRPKKGNSGKSVGLGWEGELGVRDHCPEQQG